jgi:hypothetical protein
MNRAVGIKSAIVNQKTAKKCLVSCEAGSIDFRMVTFPECDEIG